MIPEKRFLNQIQQVLARLMQPLWLLDTEGTVLLPEENRSKINLPEFMEPGMPVAFEGKTFLMIGITPELILCADAQGAATHDCIVLAGAMVQSMGRGEAPIQSRYDVYRRVLREELAGRGYFLSSANSINWGRLLPQIVYYVSAYCDLLNAGTIEAGTRVNFCVPTGNFGNILSGFYAKRMGVPIGRLICASNENNVLTDFIKTGTYDRNRPFYQTASPSMDILISSNLERLLSLLSGSDEEVRGYMQKLSETGTYTVSDRVLRAVQAEFSCGFCTDAQGAQTIGRTFRENRYLLDTHTAVACTVLDAYRSGTGDQTLTVVESTASPFKFCASVLDALGVTEHAPGTGVLGQLTAETGRPAPGPLASLAGKPVRFDQVTDRGDMRAVVTEFLR